jgi:membrane-associated phospholipid phosphatase
MKANFLKSLSQTDLVVIAFYIFLIIVNIVFHSNIDHWLILNSLNIVFIFCVIWLANKAKSTASKLWKNLHYYYVVPIIFLSFKQVYILLSSIHTTDFDNILIEADRLIFGHDPTVFLYQYANPLITEILQIAYGTFFLLPLILGIEYHFKKDFEKFNYVIFLIVFGFFLSYVGYFFLPAVGPRFTLHNFDMTNIELPGLWLTNFLREVVNSGESIPSGTLNPMEVVQRDVFPSGHTQMTLLVMYLAVKFKSKNKWFFLIDGTLLIFATVYLRYHYFVDLLGGTLFMLITLILGKKFYNWHQKKLNKPPLYF